LKRHNRVVRPIAFLCAAVFLAAGCGGGGGGGKRLSRQEFDSKGNAICAKYNAKQKSVAQPKSINDLSPALRKLLPLARQQLSELKKLNPPQSDDAVYKKLLARAQEENDLVANRLLAASDKKDIAKIQQLLNDLQTLDQQNNTDAKKLGLSTCAQQTASS
jgi:ribose 1,5-bisphosphokinase PhnN